MAVTVSELAPGLWRWAGRHPGWHASGWGAQVASFALRVRGDAVLLLDPLLPADGGEEVDALLGRLLAPPAPVHVYITIPYHVRSTAAIVERCDARRVTVWGERRLARRLPGISVREVQPGAELPFGGRAFPIGRPRRAELPLWIEDHAAIAFGDALVGTQGGELRIWSQEPPDAARRAFLRDRFAPTLAPLLELPCERVLVTHGAPVLRGGAAALRAALHAPPWYHRG